MKTFVMIFFAFLLCLVFLSVSCSALEPQAGFVWHYPFEDKYTGDLEGLGATVMNSRIPWVVVEPREGEYDFSCLDRQLSAARLYGFRLILIIEFNPFCKPGWLYEKCKEAGEITMKYGGAAGSDNMPSLSSPIYRSAQEKLVAALTDYLEKNDKEHTVIGYEPGVEWWHFLSSRYNKADAAGFGGWLQNKYKDVSALNSRWETGYASFEEAQIPPLEINLGGEGAVGTGSVYVSAEEPRNIAWYNSEPVPFSGNELTFTAEAENREAAGQGSFLTIAWFKKGSVVPIASRSSVSFGDADGKTTLSVTSSRPPEAYGFSIYMLLVGFGKVTFGSISVEGDGQTVTVPAERIVFDPRTKTEDARGEYKDGCWTISTKPYSPVEVSLAMAVDYQEYWQDISAAYLDSLAAMVKKYDKSRFVSSFLSFAFAFAAEWDYNVYTGFVPDKVFRAGKNLDVLGMQLPGAEGDPYRIAAGMDLARKYGKPLCNIDLIDFNGGALLPVQSVKFMAHTSIMHGADKIIFCNYEAYDENSFRPYYTPEEIRSLIAETKAGLKAAEGFRPAPDIAIINPFVLPFPGLEGGSGNDSRSLIGWYKLMEDRQLEADVLSFNELGYFDLSGYRAIILPHSPYMPDTAFEALKRFEGLIISVRDPGIFDETGRRRPEALSGSNIVFCEDYGRLFTGAGERHKRVADTPPMIQIRELSPGQLKALERGLKVLDPLQKDRIATLRTSRVMRMYNAAGDMLYYVVNTSGEENSVQNVTGAREIITEKGRVGRPVFSSFCIIRF
ncbi:MAG: beta-galactosidase [Abditibacteriota bacterium]|nr:beta-galactosidase [Abditibacteriota bacterium]